MPSSNPIKKPISVTISQATIDDPDDQPALDDTGEHVGNAEEANDESDTVVNDGPLLDETADINDKELEAIEVDEEGEKEARLEESSPSPALEIEGVVTGEPDEGGVQSEGGNFREADESEVYKHFFS